MSKSFKAVLFDKDGTLIESDGTWVPFYREVLQIEKGISLAQADEMMISGGYDPVTGKILSGSVMAGGTSAQLVDLWWPDAPADVRREITRRIDHDHAHLSLKSVQPLGDLTALFDFVEARRLLIGLATNDTYPSAKGQIDALGLTSRFAMMLTSDRVPRAKPSGDMIRAFADAHKIAPSSIIMVGDNHHDIDEARAGGAGLAIAVLTGNGAADDLRAIADHVLPSISDLPRLLENL
jgi:phosphoglycolate phosphatase